MIRSAHVDSFARDNLPPAAQWPEFLFSLPELRYPERFNCVTELLDRWIAAGHGGQPCLLSMVENLSYAELAAALRLKQGSVGTLLARAEEAFRKEYVHRYGKPPRS